jgi:hypothetical protein
MRISDLVRAEINKNNYKGVEDLMKAEDFCINTHPVSTGVKTQNRNYRFYKTDYRKGVMQTTVFSLLHNAVVNLYLNGTGSESALSTAVQICRLLLQRGANPTSRARYLQLYCSSSGANPDLKSSRRYFCIFHGLTPLQALIAMQNHMEFTFGTGERYKEITQLLREAEARWQSYVQFCSNEVPSSLLQSLKKLRHSTDCDFMTFQCKDNVDVTAHPAILSACSMYFQGFFTGPWAKECPDRCWKTEYTSAVITVILDFLYMGQVRYDLLENNSMLVYQAAAEFELDDLRNVACYNMSVSLSHDNCDERLALGCLHEDYVLTKACRDYMIVLLSCDNIKSRLELAYTSDDDVLKEACLAFTKAHFNELMLNPEFAALPLENPDLWRTMFSELIPGGLGQIRGTKRKKDV